VFAGVDGVGCLDVEGSSVLSEHWGEAQRYVLDRQFIAKIEMAMSLSGVGGEEVDTHPDKRQISVRR